MCFRTLISVFCAVQSFVLETIAPKDPEIQKIENLGFEGFDEKALKSISMDVGKDTLCLYSYRDPLVKKAVLEVKSYGNKAIAAILGKAAHQALVDEISERALLGRFDRPILVPIPMTRKSMRARGWNQCMLVALALKEYDKADEFELMPEALIKIRATEDQVGKGRLERFRNLEKCFEASLEVKNRNVIVLDDICTTGATFKEAQRALKTAGARNILCIALAH